MSMTQQSVTVPDRPKPRKEVVKVKVSHDLSNGGYRIVASHDLPTTRSIVDQLPPKLRTATNNYFYSGQNIYSLMNCMTSPARGARISSKAWSLAIAKAIALNLSEPSEAEIELVRPHSAFLSVGNRLYRLDCIDELPTPITALPALRRNIMESAKTEAQALVNAGTEKKQALINEGQRALVEANHNAARIRSEHAALSRDIAVMPPAWLRSTNYPIRHNFAIEYDTIPHFLVGLPIKVEIKEVKLHRKFWYHHVPEGTDLPFINVRIWLSLDRSYSVQGNLSYCLSMDEHCPVHPHCTHDRSCFEIADCPDRIGSLAELERFRTSIERAMSGINLDSPLINPHGWPRELIAILPPALKAALRTREARSNWSSILRDLPSDPDPQAATFHVPQPGAPVEAPTIATAPQPVIAVPNNIEEEEL